MRGLTEINKFEGTLGLRLTNLHKMGFILQNFVGMCCKVEYVSASEGQNKTRLHGKHGRESGKIVVQCKACVVT